MAQIVQPESDQPSSLPNTIPRKVQRRRWSAGYRPLTEPRNGTALEAEISALKQLNQMRRDQLDDTRGQRDKWEQAAQMALRQLPAPKTPTRSCWWPIRRAA